MPEKKFARLADALDLRRAGGVAFWLSDDEFQVIVEALRIAARSSSERAVSNASTGIVYSKIK